MFEVSKDALHVPREDACDEVEPDQVMVGAILTNFSVLGAIVHVT